MRKLSQYHRQRMLLKNEPRKVLSLEERVQAIRMYDSDPVYQRVALIFRCSWKQIKRVVSNREVILHHYAQCFIIDANDKPSVVRGKHINFLGSAVFEYIKRAHYHKSLEINDMVLRERAQEFCDVIKIENFDLGESWLGGFKQFFNVDLDDLNRIVIPHPPQRSLDCQNILAHLKMELECVKSLSKEGGSTHAKKINPNHENKNSDDDGNCDQLNVEIQNQKRDISDKSHIDGNEIEDDEINEDEEGPMIDFADYEYIGDAITDVESVANEDGGSNASAVLSRKRRAACDKENAVAKRVDTNDVDYLKKVENYTAALKYLRPLEDFAILEEDFRAINLLHQLADSYERAISKRCRESQ